MHYIHLTFHEHIFPFHTISQTLPIPDPFPDLVYPKPVLDFCPDTIPTQQPIQNPTNHDPTQTYDPDPNNPDPPPYEPDHNISDAPTQPIPPTRRSIRPTRPPSYLQNYQCNYTSNYPITNHISYRKLSPTYKAYIM